MGGSGGDGQQVLPGSGGGDIEEQMMLGGSGRLLLQKMVLRSGSGRLQQVMVRRCGALLLEQMLLRCGMSAELEGRGVVIRLRRLRWFGGLGRFRRLWDGKAHHSGQAQKDRRKCKKDGERASPLHGTT